MIKVAIILVPKEIKKVSEGAGSYPVLKLIKPSDPFGICETGPILGEPRIGGTPPRVILDI